VSIRLSKNDLDGDDILALTKSQLNKLATAYQNNEGVTIKMSPQQIKHNLTVKGGFLGMLAGLAARFLPMIAKTLGIGALSGLAHVGVQKAMGKGLYLKKGGSVCQIETDGKGVFLSPTSGKGLESQGDGLYIKRKDGLYDGRGLLLGPNSPFKNIPILGLLL